MAQQADVIMLFGDDLSDFNDPAENTVADRTNDVMHATCCRRCSLVLACFCLSKICSRSACGNPDIDKIPDSTF